MSFYTGIRRRRSCESLIPVLQAQPLSLRENCIKTHDIAIRIRGDRPQEERELRFIIVTPSAALPKNNDSMVSRLEHHASVTGDKDFAVVFFLSSLGDTQFPSPLHAFSAFQILLMESRISMPLLLLTEASSLPKVLSAFAKPFMTKMPAIKAPNPAMDLLPFCTTDVPLPQQTLVAITDITTDLRDVAGLGVEDAKRLCESGMAEGNDIQGVLTFFQEEWVAE